MKIIRSLIILAGAGAAIFGAVRLGQSFRTGTPSPAEFSPPAARTAPRTETAGALTADADDAPPKFLPARGNYGRALREFRINAGDAGGRIIREDETGLVLEFTIPEYRVSGDGGAGVAQISGYLPREEPGRPILPVRIFSLPLPGVESITVSTRTSPPRITDGIVLKSAPPEGRIQRELENIWNEKTLSDPILLSALSPRWREFLEAGQKIQRHQIFFPEEAGGKTPAGEEDDWYPQRVVEVSSPLWRGEEQFVNIQLSPLQYSTAGEKTAFSDRITVEIAFGEPVKTLPKRSETSFGAQFELAASPDSFRAAVTRDGIQIISYADLAVAGFDLGRDTRSLRMYFRGEEIAIQVAGEETGTWDPGDYIAFYGQENTGFYSQTNTYWLYQTAGAGRRMETVPSPRCGRPSRQDSFLDRLHLEERLSYQPFLPVGQGEDCWFWDFAGYTYGLDYPSQVQFNLIGLSDRERPATFTGRYFGYTSYLDYHPDHHTRVTLNGHLLGDFIWDGQTAYTLQTDLPPGLLIEGLNTITTIGVNDLGLPISGEFVFIDSFDLTFYRNYESDGDRLTFTASGKGDYRISGFSGPELSLYAVSDPAAPRRISEFSVQTQDGYTIDFRKWTAEEEKYQAIRTAAAFQPPLTRNIPSDPVSPRRVDYIILTHPDFAATVADLADFRRVGGLRVETFQIADIYNTFGFGNFTPFAIRDFFQYAYTEWDQQTRPRFALLVGDGHYDYRNYLGLNVPNYLPPYMFQEPYMETATDNWYGCLIGDDPVPDIDLGRLPVRTAGETAVMVQKTIDYENSTAGLPWQRNVLMVADNPDPAAGNFPADSDWLIEHSLPPTFTAQTAYLSTLGLAATRTAILNGINTGKLLVNYIGHGSVNTWSSPFIFRSASLSSLSNADRLHLLVTPTCLNGYWCDVSGACLAEAMTLTAGKGSVAAISPSGFSLNTPARQLTGFLFEELLTENHPLGTALSRAKARLAGVTPHLYTLDIYILFGDPALQLK